MVKAGFDRRESCSARIFRQSLLILFPEKNPLDPFKQSNCPERAAEGPTNLSYRNPTLQ